LLLPESDSPMRVNAREYHNGFNQFRVLKVEAAMFSGMRDWITTRLVNDPRVQPYRYAVLGALNCFEPIDSFLPPALNDLRPIKESDYLKELVALDKEESRLRLGRQSRILPGAPQGPYAVGMASNPYREGFGYVTKITSRLRYVLEVEGVALDWSTVFGSTTLTGKNRYVTLPILDLDRGELPFHWLNGPKDADLLAIFSKRRSEVSPNMTDYENLFRGSDVDTEPLSDSKAFCSGLRERSLQVLGRR
jgi:hypothetical protein